jgi:hypothetical protein
MLGRRLFLLLGALACAPQHPAPGRVGHAVPPTCAPNDALALRGNLGQTPVGAWLEETESGWSGELFVLGQRDRFELTGVRGRRIFDMEHPEADMPSGGECGFEVRARGEVFGTLAGRCNDAKSEAAAPFTLEGHWRIATSEAVLPAFLADVRYLGLPDELYLALAREEPSSGDCAPFIDVREVRALSATRRALVYRRREACAAEGELPRLEPYRLAFVDVHDTARPVFAGALRGTEGVGGEPALAVHEIGAKSAIFALTFTTESANGRSYWTQSRALLGLTAEGRTGELFELPDLSGDGGCEGPTDTTTAAFVELDGSPPAELVLQDAHVEIPCTDHADEHTDDLDHEGYRAYRFDLERASFVPLPLASGPLSVRWRHAWEEDVSRRDETWLYTGDDCR